MRTLRLSLVATVVLTLLGGIGGAVRAQDGAMAPALVTGTETCTGGEVETAQMEGYHLLHAISPEGHCTVTASDPRINGPSTVSPMWDACFLMAPGDPPVYPSGCIYWGEYGIEGPDGNWVGTWTGVDNVELDGASLLILVEGTEAYEGWSFMGHWLEPFTGEPPLGVARTARRVGPIAPPRQPAPRRRRPDRTR